MGKAEVKTWRGDPRTVSKINSTVGSTEAPILSAMEDDVDCLDSLKFVSESKHPRGTDPYKGNIFKTDKAASRRGCK